MVESELASDFPMVTCVQCQTNWSFEPGQSNITLRGSDGKQLTHDKLALYAQDRFKCPMKNCATEQCRQCGATPYHLGMTCDEYKTLIPCRYCGEGLEHEVNTRENPMSDICAINDACLEKSILACAYLLPCGHRCGGIKNEPAHPECLDENCKVVKQRNLRNLDCLFCCAPLNTSPSLGSACGHFFHDLCLNECLSKGWHTKRITFNFLDCPGCRKEFKLMVSCGTKEKLTSRLDYKLRVVNMATKKLKFEGKENDQPMKDKDSKYYNNPTLYAINTYAIYPCFKCSKPFIGGKVSCEREQDLNDQHNGEAFKPEDYICPDCSGIAACRFHGRENMIHKCKFCCLPSVWFCFGNTHFCDDCHGKQVGNRQYAVTPYLWKKCMGVGQCRDCAVDHPPPGNEFSLGCLNCMGS
jgi:E3 ubiquitin-protein ligase MYCBP2